MAAKNTRNDLNQMKLGTRGTQRSKMKNGGFNMVSKNTKGGQSQKKIGS